MNEVLWPCCICAVFHHPGRCVSKTYIIHHNMVTHCTSMKNVEAWRYSVYSIVRKNTTLGSQFVTHTQITSDRGPPELTFWRIPETIQTMFRHLRISTLRPLSERPFPHFSSRAHHFQFVKVTSNCRTWTDFKEVLNRHILFSNCNFPPCIH